MGIKMDLKETRLDSELMYEGDFIQVRKDRVRLPDGAVSSREYITHPGAVAVLAMLDNGNLVMERQYRYPLQREFVEPVVDAEIVLSPIEVEPDAGDSPAPQDAWHQEGMIRLRPR